MSAGSPRGPAAFAARFGRLLYGRGLSVTDASALNLSTRVLLFGCQFIGGVILARTLQPAGRGQYAILVLLPHTIYTLGNLGLITSISYIIARDPGRGRVLNANSLVVAAALTVLYATLLLALFDRGGLLVLGNFITRQQILWIGVALFPIFMVGYAQALFLGQNYIPATNALRLNESVTFLVLVLGLAVSGHLHMRSAFAAWIATRILNAGIAAVFLRRTGLFGVRPEFSLLWETVTIGLKVCPVAICSLIILQSDLYLIQYFHGDAATGVYGIAASLSFLILSVPQSIGTALFPHVARAENQEGLDTTARTMMTCRITNIVAPLGAFGAMLCAPLAIHYLYGAAFDGATRPFWILAVGITIAGPAYVLDAQLHARGVFWIKTLLAIFSALVNIVLNFVLIPEHGIIGAAVSSFVAYALYGLSMTYF